MLEQVLYNQYPNFLYMCRFEYIQIIHRDTYLFII